ncbi:hypothetical protein [Serratia fonticola]|uniref:hypothetical protein n=1 Tax=Serratia fonticola TaxID=47917 RepID=UPI003AAA4604
MFTPTVVATVGSSIEHNSLSFENWIMLASGITISPLAIGVKLWSGAFMSYIPLYLALIPIVYWVLKIASAFVVSRYAHPKSISYLVKDEGGRQVTEKSSFSNGENFLDATLSVFRRKEHRDGKR